MKKPDSPGGHSGPWKEIALTHYLTRLPHPALRTAIRCYWLLETDGTEPSVEPVFPDGSPEWVFHLDRLAHQLAADGRLQSQPAAMMAGQLLRPLAVRLPARARMIGVRFHPGGAACFVRMPAHRMTSRTEALGDVMGDRRALSELHDRLSLLDDFRTQARLLDAFLLRSFAQRDVGRTRLGAMISSLRRSGYRLRVETMARNAGVSARQLERVCLRQVGLPPVRLIRVLRFDGVIKALGSAGDASAPGPPLAELALRFGYSDQAHMTREFRALTGVTPASYRRGGFELHRTLIGGESP